MLRSLAVIVAAIQLRHPDLPASEAERYATVLREQAEIHDFDPITGVAIISHESRFVPEARSKNGEDFGLAQIRARYIGACKGTKDPVRHPTPACRAVQQELLTPEENIKQMALLITRNRKFCQKKVGSSTLPRWLASYQGRNNPRKRSWCKPGDGTYRVIRTRNEILRGLKKKGLI
jgi:Transglycosylase SLT domain